MGTAEDLAFSFNARPDGLAAAMRAARDKRLNGALETVEGVALALHRHFKALVVIISADFTFSQCPLKKKRAG